MPNVPPMVKTWEPADPNEPGVRFLLIEHADHQSYSRAVDPAAMRTANTPGSPVRDGRRWALTQVTRPDASPLVPDLAARRALSRFRFNLPARTCA